MIGSGRFGVCNGQRRRNPESPITRRQPPATALLVVTIAGGVLGAPAAQAQARPVLHAGAAVRVWIPALDTPIRGTLFTWSRDSVWMFVDSAVAQSIAFDDVALFEVNIGRHPALTVGATVAGGLVGAVLGPAMLTDDDRCQAGVVKDPDCEHLTSDVVIGAAVGALAFGVLGRRVARVRWREVPIDRLRAVLRWRPGGWSVAVHVPVYRW